MKDRKTKSSPRASGTKRRHFSPQEQERLLGLYDKSGLSVWRFTRQQGLSYSSFSRWLVRRNGPALKEASKVRFTQVALPKLVPREEKIQVRLSNGIELQLNSPVPGAWVAELIRALSAQESC